MDCLSSDITHASVAAAVMGVPSGQVSVMARPWSCAHELRPEMVW
ncbi:hypothetical protein [Corallococcus sp. 4LFB]